MKKYLKDAKYNDLLFSGLTEWTNHLFKPATPLKKLSDLRDEDLLRVVAITYLKKSKRNSIEKHKDNRSGPFLHYFREI